MKYMLLIYHDEQSWSGITEAERQQVYLEYRALRGELESRGQFVSGSELQPVSTATTVRVRDGKELITDGPFGRRVQPRSSPRSSGDGGRRWFRR